jgi:outer membrane protein OmpA-like peptidoglycan-associated protein
MRRSDWEFQTSSSDSAGKSFVTGSKGNLWFKKKDDGLTAHYWYVSLGVSIGPAPFGASSSTTDMWSTGTVYILPSFSGAELAPSDFAGYCMIADASITGFVPGSIRGISGTAMFVGATWKDMLKHLGYEAVMAPVKPLKWLYELVKDSDDVDLSTFTTRNANALVVMASENKGSPSGSLSGSFGYMTLPSDGVGVTNAPEMNIPAAPEDMDIKTSSQGRQEGPPIVLPGDALFAFNHWDLKAQAIDTLKAARIDILRNLGKPVLIEGYTDSIGSVKYNLALSKWRAEAVKTWLAANGVPNPTYTVGYGKDPRYAVASNKTPEGRKRNRRIQIKIMQSTWRPR